MNLDIAGAQYRVKSDHWQAQVLSIFVCLFTSREPAGGEEKTERESRLIRETRMSKGRNCQPGYETDSRLSSDFGVKCSVKVIIHDDSIIMHSDTTMYGKDVKLGKSYSN